MSAAEHRHHLRAELTEGSLRAVRAELPHEQQADFDAGYRAVMADATRTQDLTELITFLRRWQLIAIAVRDRAAHESVLRRAEALVRGERVDTETWARTSSRLGL